MKKLDRPIASVLYNRATSNLNNMLWLKVSERLTKDLHNKLWLDIIFNASSITLQLKQNTRL